MKWPNEENRYWLDFLMAEKNRIESRIRAVEARSYSWLIAITGILVASATTSTHIYLIAFIPVIILIVEGKNKEKYEKIREGYSYLIKEIMSKRDVIDVEYICNEVIELWDKERNVEGCEKRRREN